MPGNLNRPFPSSLVPLFKASLSAKPFLWKWLWFAWKWNCLQNSFSRCHMKDLHLDSFWNRGTRELENSLFYIYREDLLIDVVNTRQALSRFFTLNYSSKRRQNDFVIFSFELYGYFNLKLLSTWLHRTNVFLIKCPDRVAQKVLSSPSEKQWFSYILLHLGWP